MSKYLDLSVKYVLVRFGGFLGLGSVSLRRIDFNDGLISSLVIFLCICLLNVTCLVSVAGINVAVCGFTVSVP